MTKNYPSIPRNLTKSKNSPVLLYKFFRPRLRRGPNEEKFSSTIVALSSMLRRLCSKCQKSLKIAKNPQNLKDLCNFVNFHLVQVVQNVHRITPLHQ